MAIDPWCEKVAAVTAIAIFVKTPGLSPIKTRLAAIIGSEKANVWHELAAQAVVEVALKAGIGPVYFAVAEQEGMNHPLWSSNDRLLQCVGGLGKRMAAVHTHLVATHSAGLLLGADTPQITPKDLSKAHEWLHHPTPRQVIGPSSDGGFWLYGANRGIESSLWEKVRYSMPTTRAAFEAAMIDQGTLKRLEEKTDVDEGHDLPMAHQALLSISEPTPTQARLLDWLKSSALLAP